MVTVECILNFNHVTEVLGPGGRIYFPSQLIPMIIGAFTFCRLIYLKSMKIIYPTSEPTVVEQIPVRGTVPPHPKGKEVVKDVGKLFSPPSGSSQRAVRFTPPEDQDIDPRMQNEHAWVRYIVAYLPWLSLLPRWNHDGFTLGGHNAGPQPVKDAEKRAATFSDADTLSGSPRVPEPAHRSDDQFTFSSTLPSSDATGNDKQQSQAQSRSRFWIPPLNLGRRDEAL